MKNPFLILPLWIFQCWILVTQSFTSLPTSTTTPITQHSASSLHVGNFLSGVTGTPPSQPLLTSTLQSKLVKGTSLEGKELKCVYKASQDGWSAIDFHTAADNKGSALVVALSRSGAIFGGFNPLGWRSTDDYYNSNAAFLWHQSTSKGGAIKYPILTGGNAAIFDYATGGPHFGAADLLFGEPQAAIMGGFAGPDMMDSSLNAGNLRKGKCGIGGAGSYGSPEDNKRTTTSKWPVRGNFQAVQLEIYCNAQVADAANDLSSSSSSPSWWPF